MLCYVLDIKFSAKLEELDVIPGKLTREAVSDLRKSVRELEKTKSKRFTKVVYFCSVFLSY